MSDMAAQTSAYAPHLPALTNDRAMSMMSSRMAVESSFDQAVAGVGDILRQIVLFELLREIALCIGEVLPREREDLLALQVVEVDLVSGEQRALLFHRQQVGFMGN